MKRFFSERKKAFLIVVGGSSKNSGKTQVASRLIQKFGINCAVKISIGEHHFPDSEIIIQSDIIKQPGTDTARYASAGAEKVFWIDTTDENLPRALKKLSRLLEGCQTVLIESNTVLSFLKPDYTIFIAGAHPETFKPSALEAVREADLICINRRATGRDQPVNETIECLSALNGKAKIACCRDEDECANIAIMELHKALG